MFERGPHGRLQDAPRAQLRPSSYPPRFSYPPSLIFSHTLNSHPRSEVPLGIFGPSPLVYRPVIVSFDLSFNPLSIQRQRGSSWSPIRHLSADIMIGTGCQLEWWFVLGRHTLNRASPRWQDSALTSTVLPDCITALTYRFCASAASQEC